MISHMIAMLKYAVERKQYREAAWLVAELDELIRDRPVPPGGADLSLVWVDPIGGVAEVVCDILSEDEVRE